MIALTGSSGYIGSEFAKVIAERGIGLSCVRREEYSDFQTLRTFLFDNQPELLINCAAFVTKPSVDLCEDHKYETLMGNLVLPATITHACRATHTPLLHVSTGCLFNGENGGKGYSETDVPHLTFNTGAGYYVGSKEAAEHVVREYDNAYICRIRIPFDHIDNDRNYLSKLQRFDKVYNGRNSLAHRGDFVKACLDLFQMGAPYGTYNVVNVGSVSAQEICIMIRLILKREKPFEYWDEREFMTNVARTIKSNCTLDVSKLLDTGVKMRTVHEAVEDSLKNWHVSPPI
jgi:dTDP-4-dehydrorhamnose reductase